MSIKKHLLSYISLAAKTEAQIEQFLAHTHRYSSKYISDSLRIMLNRDKSITREKKKNDNNRRVFFYSPAQLDSFSGAPVMPQKTDSMLSLTTEKDGNRYMVFTKNRRSNIPEGTTPRQYLIGKEILEMLTRLDGLFSHPEQIKEVIKYNEAFDLAIADLLVTSKIIKRTDLGQGKTSYAIPPPRKAKSIFDMLADNLVGKTVYGVRLHQNLKLGIVQRVVPNGCLEIRKDDGNLVLYAQNEVRFEETEAPITLNKSRYFEN